MNLYKAAFLNGIGRIFVLPRLSIPLILTLGLTLGAVLSVIAIASALLLQPLKGVKDEDSIKTLDFKFKMSEQMTISYWTLRNLANFNESFKHIGVWAGISTTNQDITIGNTQQKVTQHSASDNILEVLGTKIILGQGTQINNIEDSIWISKSLWQSSFGAAPNVIGKQITIDDKTYAIAGVLEDLLATESREQILEEQVWLITSLGDLIGKPEIGSFGGRMQHLLLKANKDTPSIPSLDDVNKWMEGYISTYTEEQRASGLLSLIKNLPKEWGSSDYRSTLLGETKGLIIALFVTVSGLLLMAVINLLNLFIAHYQGRTKEFAIQLTLGSSLNKMRTLVFLENAPSFLIASIVGLLTAGWVIKALPLIASNSLPFIDTIHIDLTTILSSLIIVFTFSLIVSALSLVDVKKQALATNLSSSGKGTQAQSNQWLSRGLTVIQLSIASLLLTASVLLAAQSYDAVYRDLGYDLGNHYVIQVRNNDVDPFSDARDRFIENNLYQGSSLQELHHQLDNIITTSVPNSKVIINSSAPLSNGFSVSISSPSGDPSKRITYENKHLSSGYFEAFNISFLAGSNLTQEQIANSEQRIVIDETMAQIYFPGVAYADIIGQPLESSTSSEEDNASPIINGIVVNTQSRAGITSANNLPAAYSANINDSSSSSITISLPEGESMTREMIEAVITAQFPHLEVTDVSSLHETWKRQTSSQRISLSIVLAVTGLTLLLAAIGVAGLTQMATNHRIYELAIHMALGAKQSRLVYFIFKDATWMLIIGLGLGFAVSVFGYQSVQQQITILPSFNWTTMGMMDLGLITIVVLAVITPAWRTIKSDPIGALRQE